MIIHTTRKLMAEYRYADKIPKPKKRLGRSDGTIILPLDIHVSM